jgi:hypothetical protein
LTREGKMARSVAAMAHRSRLVKYIGAMLAATAFVVPAAAQVAPPVGDNAPVHGYIEPCTVAIVEDGNVECEACKPSQTNSRLCEETLGARGYERKCRTGGHSAPGEVWCIEKRRKEQAARDARLAYVPVVAALSASALFGVFLWLKRRRSSK